MAGIASIGAVAIGAAAGPPASSIPHQHAWSAPGVFDKAVVIQVTVATSP